MNNYKVFCQKAPRGPGHVIGISPKYYVNTYRLTHDAFLRFLLSLPYGVRPAQMQELIFRVGDSMGWLEPPEEEPKKRKRYTKRCRPAKASS